MLSQCQSVDQVSNQRMLISAKEDDYFRLKGSSSGIPLPKGQGDLGFSSVMIPPSSSILGGLIVPSYAHIQEYLYAYVAEQML
jgi:hypothetical protein